MTTQEYNGHLIGDLCRLSAKVVEQYQPKAERCDDCIWHECVPTQCGCTCHKTKRDFHQLSPKEVSDGVMASLAASDRGTEEADG